MKPVKLSENIVSLLGRNLQALLKNQFSESYLNKILRLIPNHPETDDHMRKILPPDAVIGTFQVSLYSPSGINDFLDFKNAAGIQLKGKPHLIMLEIMPVVATTYNSEISINPEMLFNLLKTIVACIKNGAHMLKFGNPDLRTDDLSPGTS